MRTVSIRQADMRNATIPIGCEGENEYTQVRIDCKITLSQHPDAEVSLAVSDPTGRGYTVIPSVDGTIVVWNVTDSDLSAHGYGEVQVVFTIEGTIIGKSDTARTVIRHAVDPHGGGGGGTGDYNDLENKPQLAGVTLVGNKSLHEFGIAAESDIPDVSDKVDKVSGATSGNFAALDENGNLTDSGKKPSDFLTQHQDISGKADKADTVLDTTLSRGRQSGSTVGTGSLAFGNNVVASGDYSSAEGLATKANHAFQHVFGSFNIPDPSDAPSTARGNFVEIVGGGTAVTLSRDLRTLDWSGNERLKGTLYVNADANGTGGKEVAKVEDIPDVSGFYTKPSGGIPETDLADSYPEQKNSTAAGVDLDVSDENGNVLIRFNDGNIRTKKFNSDNGVYRSDFSYTSVAGTETIVHFFPAETRLAFHLTNAGSHAGDTIASQIVTYKYTDTSNTVHTICVDYGYNFPEYTLPEDAVSVSVAYPNNLTWGSNATLSFKVYSIGDIPRKPIILEVGTGKQYTNLRSALDYASERADAMIRYEVHLFPGTYDTLSYFTAEEIAAEGFQGLFVTNGVSLIGIGQRSEIILTATMSTSDYNTQKRNDVSTLNVVGNIAVKNMTILAENIRYAVHDDTGVMGHQLNDHIYENVTFHGENLTSESGEERSFGAGGSDMKRIIMKNCDFSDSMVIHTSDGMVHEFTVYLENCRSRLMNFGDYDSGKDVYFYLKNCNVAKIRFGKNGTHDQYMHLEGEGNNNPIIYCDAGYVYALNGVHKFEGSNVTAGKGVKLNAAMNEVSVANSLASLYGISIGVMDGVTYVQTEGWINSNTLGLSGLSVGDYLTINTSTGSVEVGTASNAIAQVKTADSSGVAYAKLM